jgi:hypothetical protein
MHLMIDYLCTLDRITAHHYTSSPGQAKDRGRVTRIQACTLSILLRVQPDPVAYGWMPTRALR